MIKEKEKHSKYDIKKTKTQILMEYLRTVAISFSFALIVTIYLTYHARMEMIKNLHVDTKEKSKMEEQLARQLVTQSDLTKDLQDKNYSVCMQVGYLYETINDYINAQMAYELAVKKAKTNNFTPYYNLARVLIAQEKFKEADDLLNSVRDVNNKHLIKFKTRSYIDMGDKYYSIGKFLKAAKSYEKARFYYNKFSKKDSIIEQSIITRLVNSYTETADIMVKSGYNSDAVRFLKKAEKYEPDNNKIKYKLAIVYSDLNPIESVKYFEPLLEKIPQDIDYGTYGKALFKAANIADLEGRPAEAKYYRYKIHSVDLFVERKVIYKNDVDVTLKSFSVKKLWFKYKLKPTYVFTNSSNKDITRLSADFVLRNKDKVVETVSVNLLGKSNQLFGNGVETPGITVTFGKNIFTKKELEYYEIDVYLYKDKKYKTLVNTIKVPKKSIYPPKQGVLERNLIGF